MNKKVKTITTYLAAGVFLFTLILNVQMSLNDPFANVADEAIAEESITSIPPISHEPTDGVQCYIWSTLLGKVPTGKSTICTNEGNGCLPVPCP